MPTGIVNYFGSVDASAFTFRHCILFGEIVPKVYAIKPNVNSALINGAIHLVFFPSFSANLLFPDGPSVISLGKRIEKKGYFSFCKMS